MNRKELKLAAKEQIKGKIGILLLCTIIINVLSFGSMYFITWFGFYLTYITLLPSFILGMSMIYLKLTKGKEINVGDVFEGFKMNFVKSIKLQCCDPNY